MTSWDKHRPFSYYQIALVLLAMLPLIGAFGVLALWQSQALSESIDHGMLSTADALSLAVDREIGIIDASIVTLADSEDLDRQDLTSFYREALRVAAKRPGSWIALFDRSGQQLVNTSFPITTPLPNRFREEPMPARRDGVAWGAMPYIRQVFATGRANNSNLFVSIAQNLPVIAVNVPVIRNGVVRYVLSMTLPSNDLSALLLAGVYEKEGGALLIDREGVVVTRTQDPAKYVGREVPAAMIVSADAPARGFMSGIGQTGQNVYRAYSRSPITGWTLAVDMVEVDRSRQVRDDLLRTAVVGIGGLAIGILIALWFAYRLRAPMTALVAKASGKSGGSPTEFMPSEMVEIAHAIDAGNRARAAEAAEHDLRVSAEARKEEADAANRAKDQFLAMLGHELRNPLAAISNAVTVMERAPAASQPMTAIVKRQSEHLRKLVDDLLDVARVTSGKIRVLPERIDLYELTAACIDNFVTTGGGANHELQFGGERVLVYADRHRMTQVVTNLLDNAFKFTPPKGRITVSVTANGDEAVLRVADTGAGIQHGWLTRIFEVFAQGDQSLDRSRGGLGLGLALAKSLVEAQRGRIVAESEGLGSGSTFTVTLARVHEETSPSERASTPEHSTGVVAKRILLVEDQADTRKALRALLETDGHSVSEAGDGKNAIAIARASPPDVAIVDLGLPDIDGFGVARAFRGDAGLRAARLIALTGYGLPDDRERALQAGFDDFIVKPVEEHSLRAALA